jgi:hypothetical protein
MMVHAEAWLPGLCTRGLGTVLLEKMETLISEDASLPPGMFRPAVPRSSMRSVPSSSSSLSTEHEAREASDRSAKDRELAGVIEERLVANAGNRLPPTGDDPQMLNRLEQDLRADEVERAIGGIAMPATTGRALPRQARPAAHQRTPHVHALVDSGCNQHLLKDLSLFVTLPQDYHSFGHIKRPSIREVI